MKFKNRLPIVISVIAGIAFFAFVVWIMVQPTMNDSIRCAFYGRCANAR